MPRCPQFQLTPFHKRCMLAAGVAAWLIAPQFFRGALDEQTVIAEEPTDTAPVDPADVDALHAKLYTEDQFPSAAVCGKCHPGHYKDWSVSQHAYAMVSPVFTSMNAKLLKLTNGTNGDFCIRCHTPVGMTMGEPKVAPLVDRSAISREGVTCVVCHRVSESYGKNNSRIAIDRGHINAPVKGPTGDNAAINAIIEDGHATGDADGEGRKIHAKAQRFYQLTTPAMCGTCHDVTSPTGLRFEEAFSHFKMSPAAERGVSCQDCHMGKEPGVFTGDAKTNYAFGSAAQVGSQKTPPRKLTNHMIVGPDYSIVHPAIFPHTRGAIRQAGNENGPGMATIDEWLQFDYEAGWGTDEFEDSVADDLKFPERWASIDDRYDARDLIADNLELLDKAKAARLKLLRNGYKLSDVEVEETTAKRVRFRVAIANGTDGHPAPTGFDAERLVWLHVTVKDKTGAVVYESGDLDPNGDVRDLHSTYVHNHRLPLDEDLLSLQSRFVLRNVRGGERERVLAVNRSASPLPFVRPARRSNILTGQPAGGRKHRQSISPGGKRWGKYEFTGDDLAGAGPYTIDVELKAAMVPVNLIHAIADVGFDLKMSPRDVADAVVAGHQIVWTKQHLVEIKSTE